MADYSLEIVEGEAKDLLDVEEGMSEFEVHFAGSIANQLFEGRTLTAKQVSKLHEIWDKHCR